MTKISKNILIVDDEESIRYSLSAILEDEGYGVFSCSDASLAYDLLESVNIDLVFLDIWLGNLSVKQNEFSGLDGLECLAKLRSLYPELLVIMISGHGTVETAVQAIKAGANDFIEKPLSLEKVLFTVEKCFELGELKSENKILRQNLPSENKLLGISTQIRYIHLQIAQVAKSEAFVLISGENGTGKELVANALHFASNRSKFPFVAVNCAAIPDELIENELFGHEKGAFTGADARRIGKFEQAHNGTLFLDEVADMSLKTQAKILRVLQEQSFERLGGTQTIHVNVRIFAASNKNLEEAIKEGTFRSDLYYRLRVFPIHLPSLRERRGDIPYLLQEFLHKANVKTSFSFEALACLEDYTWPGNVRELKNFVERMCIFYPNKIIDLRDLPPEIISKSTCEFGENPLDYSLKHNLDFKNARAYFERSFLQAKLEECGGNISKLSESIKLERSYLHRKLKQL